MTSGDVRDTATVVLVAAGFVHAAIRKPPIAIAIGLFVAMRFGGWLILAAAPVTIVLARRYQRQRLGLDASATHHRRTALIAIAALACTLPFIDYSIGAWSARSRFQPAPSADPLFSPQQSGEESLLTRIARYLGFGRDGDELGARFDPLSPNLVFPREPDDPFNWWIVVIVVVVLAVLGLLWWLWKRRTRTEAPAWRPVPATPLARLEAVGESVGRRRADHEGAITYAFALAERTGDSRLAGVGPLVSGQVYESRLVEPAAVDADLRGLEAAPPPAPPQPSLAERVANRARRLPITAKGLLYAGLGIAALVVIGWLVIPRLGDLESETWEYGAEPIISTGD
jgi:hypothetical protein